MQPTDLLFKAGNKVIDESRQGEVLQRKEPNSAERQDGSTNKNGKQYYIESYGCQMNFSDSEIVASILDESGFSSTRSYLDADLILVNTCSIRENAEQRVRTRLRQFKQVKKQKPSTLVGVLGCMAERLKDKFLEEEKLVDIVAGPDAYRSLPGLIQEAEGGQKSINVLLSREETYADIAPVRLGSNGVTAFISIMRGCDNMCSFCVVPFTRGRERSRNPQSIVAEAQDLFNKGYKEVTLLGQNVDSYRYSTDDKLKGKRLVDAKYDESVTNFAQLLKMVADVSPLLRVRFSTSHPKDMTNDVLHAMAEYKNICNYIHLPVQSGNSEVLERMNRTYDREWYVERIEAIKTIVPDCGISTDVIAGFCGETKEQHEETLSMMRYVEYDMAYMFIYSERPGTLAAKRYEDDIPEKEKKRRLSEIVALQNEHSLKRNQTTIGKTYEVLVEGTSKKSDEQLFGRNSQNRVIVFPKKDFKPGDYVTVKVNSCTSATLIGETVE